MKSFYFSFTSQYLKGGAEEEKLKARPKETGERPRLAKCGKQPQNKPKWGSCNNAAPNVRVGGNSFATATQPDPLISVSPGMKKGTPRRSQLLQKYEKNSNPSFE